MACLLKARIVEPAETAIAWEWLRKRHVRIATVVHAIVEVLPGMVFSMWSALTAASPNYRVTARRGVFCGVHPEAI
jgi:hypothetical protein